jgi:hypothetical protein
MSNEGMMFSFALHITMVAIVSQTGDGKQRRHKL